MELKGIFYFAMTMKNQLVRIAHKLIKSLRRDISKEVRRGYE